MPIDPIVMEAFYQVARKSVHPPARQYAQAAVDGSVEQEAADQGTPLERAMRYQANYVLANLGRDRGPEFQKIREVLRNFVAAAKRRGNPVTIPDDSPHNWLAPRGSSTQECQSCGVQRRESSHLERFCWAYSFPRQGSTGFYPLLKSPEGSYAYCAEPDCPPSDIDMDHRTPDSELRRGNPVIGNTNSFVEPSGQVWNLEIVHEGAWKGGRQTTEPDPRGPSVKFYDGDYAGKPRFPPLGQFVSSYYLSTLLGEDDIRPIQREGVGLNLHGGEPKWRVSGPVMDQVRNWLRATRRGNPGHEDCGHAPGANIWAGRHVYNDPGGCMCARCRADRGLTPGKTLVARWETPYRRGRFVKHWVELFQDKTGAVGGTGVYTYRSSNGGGVMGRLPFYKAMEEAKHQADLLGVKMVRTFPEPGNRLSNPGAADWNRVERMSPSQARRYLSE